MTPQEKAKEIVYKFYDEIKYMERAKQCAMIAVDEMTNELGSLGHIQLKYWQQVKKEIENL